MNVGYALSEIREHGLDRFWWRKRFLTRVVSRYYEWRGTPGTPLVDREWDNVIVLDACRYDLFEAVLEDAPLPGTLDCRYSAETGTPGYLAENFDGETFHDVVYVTANPYVNTELDDDTFHAVDPVWRDGWEEETATVLPEAVLERALEAVDMYPDKRLIVHFNQPHAPFVGDVRLGEREVSAIRESALGNERPEPGERKPTPFELLEAGTVTREAVWEAYGSNLERALPAVRELLKALPGLTAVTSDHGNALGEWATPFPIRVYGHPLGIHIPALTRVPWHTHENGDRKTVVAEPPESSVVSGDAETRERLRMLGYAE
ncbi:MAG: hypothetical protein ABEJ89_09510 [Haloarculaceae archaeon]